MSMKSLMLLLVLLVLMAAVACGPEFSVIKVEFVSFIQHKSVAVDRNIVYRNIDEVSLKMDIYYPLSADSPVPAVVYIHGGGWYSGDKTTGAGQLDIPALTARGYLVAAIDYRLAPKYKFPAQIEDVRCAIRFLRANAATYGIDPAHIGAMGDSAGGHLASLLGVTGDNAIFEGSDSYSDQSSWVQAVVDIYGPADLTLTFARDKSPHMEHVFGTEDNKSDIIKNASPVTHVSGDAPPFLIIHGEDDEVVLLDQSQALYNRLMAADVSADLVVIRNCGHGFVLVGDHMTPDRAAITNIIVEFCDRYLKCGNLCEST